MSKRELERLWESDPLEIAGCYRRELQLGVSTPYSLLTVTEFNVQDPTGPTYDRFSRELWYKFQEQGPAPTFCLRENRDPSDQLLRYEIRLLTYEVGERGSNRPIIRSYGYHGGNEEDVNAVSLSQFCSQVSKKNYLPPEEGYVGTCYYPPQDIPPKINFAALWGYALDRVQWYRDGFKPPDLSQFAAS